MDFKEIFKLNAGYLALIMFGPLLLTPFVGVFGILAFYTFLALWFYFLGIELFALLPSGHKLNLFIFKLYYFAMISSIVVGGYLVFFSDTSFDDLSKMAPVLNLLCLFFLLNCMLFISKEIILIKHNKTEIHINDYIGIFISFSLVPFVLGILFVQPTIKSIFEKHSEIVDDEIEDATEEQTQEKIISYTPRSYKNKLGELIIEQELYQPNLGEKVFLNGIPAQTGKYKIGFLQSILVVDGVVANKLPEPLKDEKILIKKEEPATKPLNKRAYKCPEGDLIIEQEFHFPNLGELAFINGQPAPTGKYKIGFLQSVYIIDGVVSKAND